MITAKSKKVDINNYTRSGNLALDMVVACIQHYRKQGIEPKAIVMNPKYYGVLQQWVAQEYGEEYVHDTFYLDTIEIRAEKIFTGNRLTVEMWPRPKAEA